MISSLFNAYANNAKELESSDIIQAVQNIKPASKGIMRATIESLQAWAEEKGIPNANAVVEENNDSEPEQFVTKKGHKRQIITA